MSFKKFIKELGGKRVEGELISTFFYSLLGALVVFFILYFYMLQSGFLLSRYLYYIIIAILTYALLTLTMRQVRAYQQFACMSGMMIGMTSGMIAGFIPGYLIGATNGLFVGGVFGMLVGIAFGIWNGKCCGVMGLMEGLMAGFMGGLMGAMTSLMLINDNVKAMALIVFLISTAILISLNYMIYFEMKDNERQRKESQWLSFAFGAILTALTILIMTVGPRSALFI